jgi:hypothetical protein
MKKTNKNDIEIHWEQEWLDMPEYIQEDKGSIKGVMVHFETLEDMEEFSKLIGKEITMKTKGIFFPVKKVETKKVYIDES